MTRFITMIYSNDQSKAEDKMNELISFLSKKSFIKRERDNVKTVIGTFMARKFSERCRGYRYQEAYIDKTLWEDPSDIALIIAKLVPLRDDEGEVDNSYSWKDHVHFF
ncbi:hypothetical protein [Paenibacillus sp. 1781tsa1]|uniref:hypothetical protein n=1 Tax=Paenibacillus sp. 1781tsa1 TaxID=2953810 RepID=UPI00209F9190|nr:hypothetical protein [Paenibacillus sp. 1781tsa1]MCP1185013.1 hypothetical protein [Paenibacillus sp. 1781tsa1]